MIFRIDEATAQKWKDISRCLGKAVSALQEAELILMLELDITEGKPYEAVHKAVEALHGLPYLFTPQPEWTGGDSTDPKNHAVNLPHIARQTGIHPLLNKGQQC